MHRTPSACTYNSLKHFEYFYFDLINSGRSACRWCCDVRKAPPSISYKSTISMRIMSGQWRSATRFPAGDDRWRALLDGGVVSNTPITYVSDERPLTTARIIQVDVFNSQGELPRNLSQVSERAKDIQYASRTRLNVEQIREFGELRAACRRLVGKLPPALKSDPDAIKLAAACDERSWTIIRLINTRPSRSGLVKDYEFSRATITEAWTAGLEDVRRSVPAGTKSDLRPVLGL